MIDRYKKSGGFSQLLLLLETCGAQKQSKFIEIIKQEDARWAAALKAKMLTFEQFLTWSDSAIGEVLGAMLEINIAPLVRQQTAEVQARLLNTIAHRKRRQVEDILENQPGTPAEYSTSLIRFYETFRKLVSDGTLRLDKVDPQLHIDTEIEEKLSNGADIFGVPTLADVLGQLETEPSSQGVKTGSHLDAIPTALRIATAEDSHDHGNSSAELSALRKKVIELQKENGVIKQELLLARSKLEQIRKIA